MKDLTGQQFGRLTAICPTQKRAHGSVVWKCSCSCGNTAFVSSAGLSTGKTRSCGCLQKENAAKNGAKSSPNLSGQRFGRLTVIGRSEKRQTAVAKWECRCDCGNITYLSTSKLKNYQTKSCGCLRQEYLTSYGKGRMVDLAGQRFGRLTAIRPIEERKAGRIVWECVCECGNTAYVSADSLRSGDTKSCGCLRKKCSIPVTDKDKVL